MRDGADVVFQATLFDGPFLGFADFLVRAGDVWEVYDTKLARRAKVTALLQLAAYAGAARSARDRRRPDGAPAARRRHAFPPPARGHPPGVPSADGASAFADRRAHAGRAGHRVERRGHRSLRTLRRVQRPGRRDPRRPARRPAQRQPAGPPRRGRDHDHRRIRGEHRSGRGHRHRRPCSRLRLQAQLQLRVEGDEPDGTHHVEFEVIDPGGARGAAGAGRAATSSSTSRATRSGPTTAAPGGSSTCSA